MLADAPARGVPAPVAGPVWRQHSNRAWQVRDPDVPLQREGTGMFFLVL